VDGGPTIPEPVAETSLHPWVDRMGWIARRGKLPCESSWHTAINAGCPPCWSASRKGLRPYLTRWTASALVLGTDAM